MNELETFESIVDHEEAAPSTEPESGLAAEPLFAALLRRAVAKIWGDDRVMADFVDHVAQPLSDLLGHESAKGGNFARDMQALGKDTARYSFDQSVRGHLINGLFPALHAARTLREWGAPQFRHYDDPTRRLFIAGFVLHDWLKLPGVESELEAAGFSHAESIGPAQLRTVEAVFRRWCEQLGLDAFLEPLGGPPEVLHDLVFVACNTQVRWGTLRNLGLLPRLTFGAQQRGLCEQLSRLADYLTYIARNPRDVAADASIRNLISRLSDQGAYFSYHHLADNRGILTNLIHNSVLAALSDDAWRVPVLYAPSGVVYLARKGAPAPPPAADLADAVVEKLKDLVGTKLYRSLEGFKRDGKGLKFAGYYWQYFDLPAMIGLSPRAAFRIIHAGKDASAGKRFEKMRSNEWLPAGVDLDLPDDVRVDQLAEWCYLAEKIVADRQRHFDTATFLLKEMDLLDLKDNFEAVPRDNRAGGVGYHWYFAAGHYLKRHPGLDPGGWQERVEALAGRLSEEVTREAGPERGAEPGDEWGDVRAYVGQVLSMGGAKEAGESRAYFVTELHRYRNAKRRGQGTTSTCSLCSSPFEVGKQQEAAVLFAPMVYSNKLSLHGSDALRNICSICGLETMLRQLFMNHTRASGGDFEGRRMRYLYFYPTYFFTPETREVFEEVYAGLHNPSFTDLRRQLVTGQGLATRVKLDPATLQRLAPLLLAPPDPENDRYMRMHFSELEPGAFYFLGVNPPGRDAKDAEAWIHPAFLALLLPVCLDVKVVASESTIPLLVEADELPETVFLDGPHAFVSRLAPQERVNVDEVLPTLQRLMVAYLIQMDAHSGMGRAGFDYRWQDMPAVARNLAASPLYAFHYLKKWQRRQGLDSLPIGKAHLYLSYAEDYLADERRNPMSHARELTTLYRRFYRARRYNSNSILRPLHIAAGTLLTADRRLFDSPEALTELVFGELRRRVSKLQSDGLAFFPRGSTWEERESAMRQFTDYLVNQVYLGAMKGDPSALRGKQLNMLGSACEAIYRDESAKDWAERQEVEVAEE
jgi:CRISPR-associated protein Csc3